MGSIAAAVDTAKASHGEVGITVFNPCDVVRDAVVATGRFELGRGTGPSIIVRDDQGQQIPSQLLALERNESGEIIAADVAFRANQLPALGYATYYAERTKSHGESQAAGLRTSASGSMETSLYPLRSMLLTGATVVLVSRRKVATD
jgi:hypothetical protein